MILRQKEMIRIIVVIIDRLMTRHRKESICKVRLF